MSQEKITCKQLEEEISAYLDGELDEEHAKIVVKHLELCRDCRKQAESLQQMWQCLDDYHLEDTTEGMPVGKFYTHTLPGDLLQNPDKKSCTTLKTKIAAAFLGALFGLLIYQLGLYQKQKVISEEIRQNIELFKNKDFELIHEMELLEHYEVFKHYSHRKLTRWRKQH